MERVAGVPWRLALGLGIVVAGLGAIFTAVYWDLARHADRYGIEGFINLAHLTIAAGFYALILGALLVARAVTGVPLRRLRPATIVRQVPGVVVIVGCTVLALVAQPLDGVWHELFSVELTIWGPTHVVMVLGVTFTAVGLLMLARDPPVAGGSRFAVGLLEMIGGAGLLVGLTVLQGEYDYGDATFGLQLQIVTIGFAAGFGLVWARLVLGPGGALKAVLFFIALRVGAALFTPVLGLASPSWALYVAEAVVVEAAFLLVSGPLARTATVAAVGIGTFGTLAELGWSHVFMSHPWPLERLPAGIVLATGAAWGGAVLAARAVIPVLAHRARARPEQRARARSALAGPGPLVTVAAVAAAAGAFAWGFVPHAPGPRPLVSVTPSPRPGDRADLTVRLHPPDAAKGADWLDVYTIARDLRQRRTKLREVAPGTFRTVRPVVWGPGTQDTVQLELARDRLIAPVPHRAATARFRRAPVPGLGGPLARTVVSYSVLVVLFVAWAVFMRRTLWRWARPLPVAPAAQER